MFSTPHQRGMRMLLTPFDSAGALVFGRAAWTNATTFSLTWRLGLRPKNQVNAYLQHTTQTLQLSNQNKPRVCFENVLSLYTFFVACSLPAQTRSNPPPFEAGTRVQIKRHPSGRMGVRPALVGVGLNALAAAAYIQLWPWGVFGAEL
jgi:hypothetical protein